MNANGTQTTRKVITIAALVLFGRITLVISIAYGLTHAVWGYPPDIRPIWWCVVAATAFLGVAAWLVKDPAWLFQIFVWGGAVACVLFIGAIVSAYFRRTPHTLKTLELNSGVAALGFLIPSYLFLRHVTKRRKHGRAA
jgi:hypothetical protein